MRPRIRTLKPEFFASPTINRVGVGSRYLAAGLISMADDRGRIHLMLPALRTYVFPNGDVSEKQCEKALNELIAVGFALRYEVAPWTYLWLPTFWRHQRINRPSESSFPPHPDDPHGGLPVNEAIEAFRNGAAPNHDSFTDQSLNDHGSITPSHADARVRGRAGPRSDPFLEVVEELSEHLAGRVRANDPKFDLSKASSDRWLTDMRLLLKDRDGDAEEIRRVIDFCHADHFERSNVLSPGKLRSRFTALVLKADRPQANVVPIDPAKAARAEREARGIAALQRLANGDAA